MGIRNLSKTFKKHSIQPVERSLSQYVGKKIVIDISLYLHRFYNGQGRLFTGLFHQIDTFVKHSIIPIYIFDGQYNEMKRDEVMKRKQRVLDNREKAKTDQKYENRCFELTDKVIEWCRTMLDLYGIPYMFAEGEADQLCTELVKQNYAYACLSEDTDMFAYGCPRVLRSWNKSTVEEYNLGTIIDGLKLQNEKQLIELCVLLGNDYLGNIKNVGPVKSLQLIHNHGDLDTILEMLINDSETIKEYQNVYKIFTQPLTIDINKPLEITKKELEPAITWTKKQIKVHDDSQKKMKENYITRLEKLMTGKSKVQTIDHMFNQLNL